jgi:hypothetical protein
LAPFTRIVPFTVTEVVAVAFAITFNAPPPLPPTYRPPFTDGMPPAPSKYGYSKDPQAGMRT